MLTIIYMTIIKDNFSLVIFANDHRVIFICFNIYDCSSSSLLSRSNQEPR